MHPVRRINATVPGTKHSTLYRIAMPILNILLNQNTTPAQKNQLLESVSQAVVDSIGAPLSSVRASLQTVDVQHVIVAGEIGKPMAQVSAYVLPGRTETQKLDLIAAITRAIADSVGVSDQDSRVMVHDIPATDMGVAGGISAKMAGR